MMRQRLRLVTPLTVLIALASCGGSAPPPRPHAAAAPFASLAPDVYEPCGMTATTDAVWVLGCSARIVRVPIGAGRRVTAALDGNVSALDAVTSSGADVWTLLTSGSGASLRGRLVRLDMRATVRATVALGRAVGSDTASAGETLWVAATDGGLFAVNDSAARRVSTSAPLSFVLPDAGRIWTITEDGDIVEHDAQGTVLRTFRAVAANPIAAAAGAGSVWLGSSAGVLRVDMATGSATRLGIGDTVNDIEPCGGAIWLSRPDQGVTAVDTTGKVVRDVPVPAGPRYLACSGDRLWIVTVDGRLGSIAATT